jgi:GT2 family glycosyltransferase
MNKYFAAFIITYERPAILKRTIDKILAQDFKPEHILIVDNSESYETQAMITGMNYPQLEYHRVGFNSGPAGGAKIGLEKLVKEGYQWIYWGDDNDAPPFPDSFSKLFSIVAQRPNSKIGIVGAVGQFFNHLTGEVKRVSDQQINSSAILNVTSIAGGQTMIVNANVVTEGILPDPALYFGFEELDFCLKVEHAGYELLVSTELFGRARLKYDRVGLKKEFYIKNKNERWARQYYSTRNIILIFRRNKMYFATGYHAVKNVVKAVYGFRFGWNYGSNNGRMIVAGIIDSFRTRTGKVF